MRDSFLDSSKALLIFCVVFGHFLERMIGWSDPKSHVLLGLIYSIHMPAFIFISGMLFKDKMCLKIFYSLWLYMCHFKFYIPYLMRFGQRSGSGIGICLSGPIGFCGICSA